MIDALPHLWPLGLVGLVLSLVWWLGRDVLNPFWQFFFGTLTITCFTFCYASFEPGWLARAHLPTPRLPALWPVFVGGFVILLFLSRNWRWLNRTDRIKRLAAAGIALIIGARSTGQALRECWMELGTNRKPVAMIGASMCLLLIVWHLRRSKPASSVEPRHSTRDTIRVDRGRVFS
jgi:hypothetical protein